MCGIAGVYHADPSVPRDTRMAWARAMTTAIAHRGPDADGLWADDESGLVLGHRRLSIIDLSPDGAQPMLSASGRYVIVFNGEIYNFLALRRTLQDEGAVFRGRSDTEVMLAAFDLWGVGRTLQKINGMFAFALWDRQYRRLHLVRDRLGKKPLYVGWAGQSLVFGSELKALSAHPHFDRVINRDVAALYMRFGNVPAPHSIFKNVWQLLPGTAMTLDCTALTVGEDLLRHAAPYWSMDRVVADSREHPLPPQSDGALVDQFESLLLDCVRDRMISDVPIGAFLSGGIDSSAVVALMQSSAATPVKTFSIGFTEHGYNEANDARAVAEHLGTDHHEMIVTAADALDVIPRLPFMYDEPFADSSQIPTFLVSKFARDHVTVALSGDGGDEMLGGYTRHQALPKLWSRYGGLPSGMRRMMAGAIHALPVERWNRLARGYPQFGDRLYKIADILPCDSIESAYIRVMSAWNDPSLVVPGASPLPIPLTDPSMQVAGLGFAERMMFGDALSYLPNDILVKVDRASMAVGLEARAPLLDRRVFEYCWRLGLNDRIRKGQGKWLLRQVLARHVPPALFDRPKQGFAVPIGDWLRGPLRDWAADLLDPSILAADAMLDPAPITTLWQDHCAGRGNHASRLWTVLMFQAWRRQWAV